jgi:hypothetical protein
VIIACLGVARQVAHLHQAQLDSQAPAAPAKPKRE